MKIIALALLLINASIAAGQTNAPIVRKDLMQNAVETLRFSWTDSRRSRVIPVKAYFPKDAKGMAPVILFSHGLGGSREGYSYLGRYWAEHGYISIHVQHPGSDADIWKDAPPAEVMDAMRRAAAKPGNTQDRIIDIKFAIDQLESLNSSPGPLQGRLDLKRIGVAGHSYGALTSLAIAGQTFVTAAGARLSSPDSRVRAIIAMSAPPPKNKEHWRIAYSSVRIPCFFMTGTRDVSPLGGSNPEDRRAAFDNSINAEGYFLDFGEGDHMVFVGLKRNSARANSDANIHRLVQDSSLAFWDAWLKEDRAAREWLLKGGLAEELARHATLEIRTIEPATQAQ